MMKRVMYRMLKSLMITLVITLVKNQIHILIRNHKMIMKELLMKKLYLKQLFQYLLIKVDCKSEENNMSHQESVFNKIVLNQKQISRTAEDEEIVKKCLEKASEINENIMNQRKQLKDQFKEFQNTINAARSNLKDYDMPYQTAHFPLYLKTQEKFVILPAQNLNIRKGTLESFIKTNLENENSVKKAEQDRRVAFKQRRPYQRRKFDS